MIKTSKPKKSKAKALGLVFSLLIGAGILLFAWSAYGYFNGLAAVGDDSKVATFKVEQGDSASEIGDRLEAEGLLNSRRSYDIYVRLTGASAKLKQGAYVFTGKDSVPHMVGLMVDGDVATRTVVIVPGQRLDQIKDSLVDREGFDPDEVQQAFESAPAELAFDENGQELRLEGLLFPETYTVAIDASAADVVEGAISDFESLLTPDIVAGIKSQGLSVKEAVILASIVQEEAADPGEQRKIAGVFLNRLDQDISLGADPTFRYASYLEGVDDDIDIVSPYNTRIYKGLPPGPISNFNLSAIEAVADPVRTYDIFFVAGDDGTIYYNENEADHIKDAEAHCIELCQL